ncbi:hypothetical protein E4U58_004163 [Claviceps cyperi]|nr:hypothetical protein E4U58_004163 [Claviceps cyperi]
MAGFDQYQGSGDVIRSVATIEGPDSFPAQCYYAYAPGTYLEPSHQTLYPYLYYPLPTAFYADAIAMPAAVPMRVPHTLLSAVENWVPDPEDIDLEACREIIRHGMGRHLWSLELHNYTNSPQRWSEFPDADPGDAEILDRYQTAGAYFHPGDSLLQCERCETLCD